MLATDDEQTRNNEAPPTMDRGYFVQMLLVVVMTVAVTVVVLLVCGLFHDDRLGSAGLQPRTIPHSDTKTSATTCRE